MSQKQLKKKTRLSKSKIIQGLQCEKSLYLSIHQAELAEETSKAQEMIFDQGTEVGQLAQTYFPGGVLIDARYDETQKALTQTQEAIKSGANTLYEATFLHDDVLVKMDILTRKSSRHDWEIIEVKSSTQVKDVHIHDAAIQAWVGRQAGMKIRNVSIMTINNECTFPNLKNLFNLTNVTKEAEALQADIPEIIQTLKETLARPRPPDKDIGPHCNNPYPCAFQSHCWAARKIPEVSVFNIPRYSEEKKWEKYRAGKVALKKLTLADFNATQARMIQYTVLNRRFVNPPGIASALKEWKYPLSFLDFETIAYAIPRYDGVRPYQQLPFQFSCHVVSSPRAKPKHCEYLHGEDSDPREALSSALVELIPREGSIVAYNMVFEAGVMKKLAEQFPKYRKALLDIVARLVDPLPIFREHVYDPAFRGSFSIKDVAPALLGETAGYDGMEVGGGTEAQAAYLEMIRKDTARPRKEALRKLLHAYCTKDTQGMVDLVKWLFEQAAP